MKKILALVLATLLVAAMMTTAFAAVTDVPTGKGGTATITVSNAYVGETYKVYKVFDAVSDGTTSNISYKKIAGRTYTTETTTYDSTDTSKVTGSDLGDANGNYFHVDTAGNITVLPAGKSGSDLSANAIAWIANNKGDVVKEYTVTAEGGIRFTELTYGYYYIATTTGTVVTVDSTNPTATVTDKNQPHTDVKQVQEDSDSSWGKKDDADIGQTVHFKSTITITTAGVVNLKFHDKMSNGLTFDASSVKIDGAALGNNGALLYSGAKTATVDTKDYVFNNSAADGYDSTTKASTMSTEDTFTIIFTQAYQNTLTAGQTIVVTYDAVLNENAEVVSTGNPNDSKITWGDGSSTAWDTTRTYTWKMEVIKEDGTDHTKLPGAKFTLNRKTGDTSLIKFVLKSGTEADTDTTTAVYRVATPAEIADNNVTKLTEITTNKSGTFQIEGLDADTYVLTETEAPKGYNKIDPKEITITAASAYDATTGAATYSMPSETITNNKGTELPSTGGIGTTLFYVGGGILIMLAVVLLVTKRRMSSND